jgi:hypothetical protein
VKTSFFIFVMIECALICNVSHAGPSGDGAAAKEQTPIHPAPLEQAKLPLKNTPRPGSGATIIGGSANSKKVNPAITGVVNPAKNTAVISGTGIKRKP